MGSAAGVLGLLALLFTIIAFSVMMGVANHACGNTGLYPDCLENADGIMVPLGLLGLALAVSCIFLLSIWGCVFGHKLRIKAWRRGHEPLILAARDWHARADIDAKTYAALRDRLEVTARGASSARRCA